MSSLIGTVLLLLCRPRRTPPWQPPPIPTRNQGTASSSEPSFSVGRIVIYGNDYPGLDLSGCVEKFRRAEEHLYAIDAEILRFFASKPYAVRGEFDPKSRWYVFRFAEVEPPPVRLGVLVGEYVHQLRSTLDHLVWQLAVWNHRKQPGRKGESLPKRGARFPISKGERDFLKIAWRISKLPEEWQALIHAIQPYRGPNPDADELAILEEIWNRDKHEIVFQAVHTARGWGMGQIQFIGIRDAPELGEHRLFIDHQSPPIKVGAEIARVRVNSPGPNPQVNVHGQFPFEVTLQDGGELMETLHRLAFRPEMFVGVFPTVPPWDKYRISNNKKFLLPPSYGTELRNIP